MADNAPLRYMAPHERMRMAQQLMAEQWDRPTTEEAPLQQRGSVLPFGQYDGGKTGFAWPGLIAEPVNSMARLLQNGYQPGTNDVQGVEDAFNVAGGAMTGGLAAPRPAGSIGMSGNSLWSNALKKGFELPDQAAIRTGEKIYTGHEHHYAYDQAVRDGILPKNTAVPDLDEGYITTTGRYITRGEAGKLLEAAGLQHYMTMKELIDNYVRPGVITREQAQRQFDSQYNLHATGLHALKAVKR